jgi:hypothetical protein
VGRGFLESVWKMMTTDMEKIVAGCEKIIGEASTREKLKLGIWRGILEGQSL